jgi:excisionase family DNA binding protein
MQAVTITQITVDELQTIIIDCVNSCLKYHKNETPEKFGYEKPFNILEACEFLNITRPTLYAKVHRKEVPFTKRGKRLYFSPSELTDYIKNGLKDTDGL